MKKAILCALFALALVVGCDSSQKSVTAPPVVSEDPAAIFPGPNVTPMSIGTRRYWVRNECWYALRREWLSKGDDLSGPGGNGTLSNWNWLSPSADAGSNGLRYVLNTYQTCVSDLIPSVCDCCAIRTSMKPPMNSVEFWVDTLSSDRYALHYQNTNVGHGTQCVSFVAMVIYRATGGRYRLVWNWSTIAAGSYPSAKNAAPGDIVFRTSSIHHVAICVRNYGTGITVVESNYAGHEVIGRRDISNTAIGSTWKAYSGSGRWY